MNDRFYDWLDNNNVDDDVTVLGYTRRRVANEWDEHTMSEALVWRFIGIDD